MRNITFTMIKPEAVEAGNTGAILNRMEEAGFRIVSYEKSTPHLLKEQDYFMKFIKKDLFMENWLNT